MKRIFHRKANQTIDIQDFVSIEEIDPMFLEKPYYLVPQKTGVKDLHVHVPIAPIYSWDDVKNFTHTLAVEMVERHPNLFVANMSKKIRKNKIFLDYLRNGYGATAVVPYSLRARQNSSVALPVSWEELKRIKSPSGMTLPKALRKILSRKRDPWEGFLKLKQKINILSKSS